MRRSCIRPRAFSLIEVLIAVVVLSIGLLGLGMVFPVVVRQQRIAQDQVRGLSSVRSFEASLVSRGDVNTVLPDATNSDSGKKLLLVARSLRTSNPEPLAYRWFPPTLGITATGANPFVLDPANGQLMLYHNDNDPITTDVSRFAVGERLFPAPFTSSGDPQFVNDFAIRQVDGERYEVAIFSRRVDAGIRIPPPIRRGQSIFQYNLSNVLTGTPNAAQGFLRSPVAVDARGRPTLTGEDGQGRPGYSNLRVMRFSIRGLQGGDTAGNTTLPPGARYEINPYTAGDPLGQYRTELYAAAGQPGQKFVDNLGTVHTVIRSERSVVNAGALVVYLDRRLTPEAELLRQNNRLFVIFSPQVPSAVSVMRFER